MKETAIQDDPRSNTDSLNEIMGLDNKSVAKDQCVYALQMILLHSPRYCELQDKEKSGVFMDDDETQEIIGWKLGTMAFDLYNNPTA